MANKHWIQNHTHKAIRTLHVHNEKSSMWNVQKHLGSRTRTVSLQHMWDISRTNKLLNSAICASCSAGGRRSHAHSNQKTRRDCRWHTQQDQRERLIKWPHFLLLFYLTIRRRSSSKMYIRRWWWLTARRPQGHSVVYTSHGNC